MMFFHVNNVMDDTVFAGDWRERFVGIVCPVCGVNYQHVGEPHLVAGNEDDDRAWEGRGDLVIVPFEGECGCRWEFCFGFHKGDTAAFVRVTSPCNDDAEKAGFAYFIEAAGLDTIKIGFSKHPEKRLDQLATGSPAPLRLLGKIPANRDYEGELHERFEKYRKNAEWFYAVEEIRTFITDNMI